MKKLFCMFLAFMIVLGLAACGKDETDVAASPSVSTEGTGQTSESERDEKTSAPIETADPANTDSDVALDEGDAEREEEEAEVEPEPSAPAQPEESATSAEEMVDGMRVSFKDAMDSYEAFFDTYIAFMEKYQESDDPMAMLTDYLEFMDQYTETMQKMDAWNDGTLNDAELKYYLDTTNRITQKLLAVA